MHRATHRRSGIVIGSALFLSPTVFLACAARPATPRATIGSEVSASVTEDATSGVQWGPAPAVFPRGAQMAVIQGDPGKAELFVVRLRFPSGYRIAPHTHPTDEHITVLAGTFLVGMGATRDDAAMVAVPTGGSVTAGAGQAHYAEARGVTTVQVNAMGPFALTYVNPADLPTQASR